MKKIEPTIEAILGKLDSLCDNCGACCKEVPNITLSKFEAPIIAYHLRELGGKSLVRKHLLYRPNPYNIFSDYVFVVDTGCPFHLDSKCIIYKDRPTVCKLFPIFIDAFIDNDDPNLMKIPFASFHSTHHVTCKDKIDSMNELSKQYGEEMRLRIMTAVLWQLLQDRAIDFVYAWGKQSEPLNSVKRVNSRDDVDIESIVKQIITIYGKLLGVISSTMPVWKYGTRNLTGSEVRKISKIEFVKRVDLAAEKYKSRILSNAEKNTRVS